jgi:adenylate kinase family enzyme
MARVLLIGGSGAGTSTLGRALASALATQHFDADDFFWYPTDPPFTRRRPEKARAELMQSVFLPRADWVLSGSPMGWGDVVIPRLTHAVLLSLAPELRLARLTAREEQRYGARIAPGGDLEEPHREFVDWAAGYDDPTFLRRSRRTQEQWLAELRCPVLTLDAAAEVDALVGEVRAWLDRCWPRP